jgi:hypothetical protein
MAYSVALIRQGVMEGPRPPAQEGDHDWLPLPNMKWAVVTVTLDTTTYATGGLALNVLGALTGWTIIGNASSQDFLQGATVSYGKLASPNHLTAGSRLLKLLSSAADTEHGETGTTAKKFRMYIVGW